MFFFFALFFRDFQKEKIYTNAEGALMWDSVKKLPEVKKQPTKNPKAEGKNKAAPKVAAAAPQIVMMTLARFCLSCFFTFFFLFQIPQTLVATNVHGKTFRVFSEIHNAKVK